MSEDIVCRYDKAKSYMQGCLTNQMIRNDAVFPHWIEGEKCFWYIRETTEGREYRLVDASSASNIAAFDHEALANGLAKCVDVATINPLNLPIKKVCIGLSPPAVEFSAYDRCWRFDPKSRNCVEKKEDRKKQGLSSPNGKKTIFFKNYNVWIGDNVKENSTQLTQDGRKNYSYGDPHFILEWKMQALWSPDSKRVVTLHKDSTGVSERPYVHYTPQCGGVHPKFEKIKMPYPGDKKVEKYRIFVIDAEKKCGEYIDFKPLSFSGYGLSFFSQRDFIWWSSDSQKIYFIDVERGAKKVQVIEFDVVNRTHSVLLEETSETFVKISHSIMECPLFLPLTESDELIWFSERTGWGHLYLYDLNKRELTHQITAADVLPDSGEWLVRGVCHYDAEKREILIQTAGRNKNISPYYRDICKINIDSRKLVSLVSGSFDYVVYGNYTSIVIERAAWGLDVAGVGGVSPCGQYIVATLSRVDTAPVSILVDREGKKILELELADTSSLPDDWKWPEPLEAVGADGTTNIYGVLFRPPGFSVEKSYPVIDFSGGMREGSYVPHGSFINGPWGDQAYFSALALAALGFVVVMLEGRGTPFRSKVFQDHNYGDPGSTSDFFDRIAGIRQLASSNQYMNLDSVGLTGLDNVSSSVYGLFKHADFYKAAVLHCYYDPRFWFAVWGEIYYDLSPDKKVSNPLLKVEQYVGLLQGKLLLIHGMLDISTPTGTFSLANALQKANKDFDMLCLPNDVHSVTTYGLRRSWDYLVKHLQGIEPPQEYNLVTGFDFVVRGLPYPE